MSTINSVNFDQVVRDAVAAGISVARPQVADLGDIVENIAKGLANDVAFLAKKKANGEFNEDDARIFMEDQKVVARIRLRSLAIITLQIAERVWNAVATVFRSAINTALGWTVL